MIANTYFQHPKRRLYTWRSPRDICRNKIDFILINKRFRNGVKQARTYHGADVGSDHNPLTSKMNIKLKKLKKKHTNHRMELNILKHDETDQGSDLEVVERTWQILKTMVQAAKKGLQTKYRVK